MPAPTWQLGRPHYAEEVTPQETHKNPRRDGFLIVPAVDVVDNIENGNRARSDTISVTSFERTSYAGLKPVAGSSRIILRLALPPA